MNKDDKNVEQIIEEVTKEEMARMQKQAQKQWRKIPFPLSLHDALNKYTKSELDTIRKYLEIKNASNLKKAELAHLLEQKIPEHLYPVVILWDNERFNLLLKIAENNGRIMAPDLDMDEMEYLRHTGFIYTGTWEGNKVFALPNELYDPVLALKHDLHVRATIKRNTKWIKLTRGLLYYFGVLDPMRLIQMVEKHMKEPINVRMYFKVIADSVRYCPEITVDMDSSFSHIDVFEPKEVKREQQRRESIPYYDFTEKQLLEAGEPGFVERNASYQQFVHFLTQNFDMDQEDADMIVEECTYVIKSGDSPNQVISYLSQMLEFDSEQLVKAVMDKVIHLMNNTREWVLKGHTPDEVFALEKKHLQPMPTMRSPKQDKKDSVNSSQKVIKIGRNQPCPCGSGKKHKKCCGK